MTATCEIYEQGFRDGRLAVLQSLVIHFTPLGIKCNAEARSGSSFVADLADEVRLRLMAAPRPETGEAVAELAKAFCVRLHPRDEIVLADRALHGHIVRACNTCTEDAQIFLLAHPLPSDAPVNLSAVEAAIDDYGRVCWRHGSHRTQAAQDHARALLSLYRTALSGVPAKEAGETK